MLSLDSCEWHGRICELIMALQASIIHYARSITEAATEGAAVLDCVITVPAFWGPTQRQALVDAAKVSGAPPAQQKIEHTQIHPHCCSKCQWDVAVTSWRHPKRSMSPYMNKINQQ